jgi:hypothetical protein
MGPVQKPSRPISAGKDKPRGGAKTATDPKGANTAGTDRKGGPNLGSTSQKSNLFWTPIPTRLPLKKYFLNSGSTSGPGSTS